jgi:predicted DNA-binding transcriptional regulator AlpA
MLNLLTEKEVSELLSISLATLRRRRTEGRPPQFVKIGASVRYRTEDIDAFVQSSLACTTEEEIAQ